MVGLDNLLPDPALAWYVLALEPVLLGPVVRDAAFDNFVACVRYDLKQLVSGRF